MISRYQYVLWSIFWTISWFVLCTHSQLPQCILYTSQFSCTKSRVYVCWTFNLDMSTKVIFNANWKHYSLTILDNIVMILDLETRPVGLMFFCIYKFVIHDPQKRVHYKEIIQCVIIVIFLCGWMPVLAPSAVNNILS